MEFLFRDMEWHNDAFAVVCSPVADANASKSEWSLVTEVRSARIKSKVSSAYCITGQVALAAIGCPTPPSVLIKVWSISTTNRNRYGDSGSPWRRPRRHGIRQPLTTTADLGSA